MIPSRTKYAIDRYVKTGDTGGSFITAVLTNDLKSACSHADIDNRAALVEIVEYCYNHIPAVCWGSEENVRAWAEGFFSKNGEERICGG